MDHERDNELANTIGGVAREARTALGLTQEDVAESIGVSGEFYARIERGHALPSVQTLARIASVLRVRVDALLGRVKARRVSAEDAPPARDAPEIRRLVRRLRRASPDTLRVVTMLLKELDRRR